METYGDAIPCVHKRDSVGDVGNLLVVIMARQRFIRSVRGVCHLDAGQGLRPFKCSLLRLGDAAAPTFSITLLGHLDNGLGYYRFSYNGSDKAYVGVMAQEARSVRPEAVMRGHDGYLWVNYDMLGLRRMTWDQWVASGEKIPAPATRH
jgi:hypothetical protein